MNITIVNQGIAPFYYPLSLQLMDSANNTLTHDLPQYLPGQTGSPITLDVSSLLQLNNESIWILSLHSDYILPNQEILFATTPGNGLIQVK